MPKVDNKMEKKSEEKFILMQATIENNEQEMKAEMKDIKETLKISTTFMMDQTNISISSPTQKDTSTPPDPTIVIPTNRGIHNWKGGTL